MCIHVMLAIMLFDRVLAVNKIDVFSRRILERYFFPDGLRICNVREILS